MGIKMLLIVLHVCFVAQEHLCPEVYHLSTVMMKVSSLSSLELIRPFMTMRVLVIEDIPLLLSLGSSADAGVVVVVDHIRQ